MERDNEINKQLLFMGWTVIRFWGKEILKDVDNCVRVVEEVIWDIKISSNTILTNEETNEARSSFGYEIDF